MPSLPTPPTNPRQIDAVLAGKFATGRSQTWAISGSVAMTLPVWYVHQTFDQTSSMYDWSYEYDFGPFEGTGISGLPQAVPGFTFQVGPIGISCRLSCTQQEYRQVYIVKDQFGSSPPFFVDHDSETETLSSPSPVARPLAPGPFDGSLGSPTDTRTGSIGLNPPKFLGTAGPATFDVYGSPVAVSAVGVQFTIGDGVNPPQTSAVVTGIASEIARLNGTTYTSVVSAATGPYPKLVRVYSGEFGIDLIGGVGDPDYVIDPDAVQTTTVRNDISIQSLAFDIAITVSVDEYFIRSDRSTGEYRWQLTSYSVTIGGETIDYAPPGGVGTPTYFYLDSVVEAGVSVSLDGDLSPWGYTADFYATLSDWSLSGTDQGNDFTGFPTTVASETAGLVSAIITPTSIRCQLDIGGTDAPVSSTSTDPEYGWHIASVGPVVGFGPATSTNVHGGVGITITPTTATRFAVDELWWDGTAFTRDPADADGLLIAGFLDYWNTALANAGTFITFTNGHGVAYVFGVAGYYGPATYAGFSGLGTAGLGAGSATISSWLGGGGGSFGLTPDRFSGTPIPPDANRSQLSVYCPGESWFTDAALNRILGTIKLTKTPLGSVAIALSVSSRSDGTNNTATQTADAGQWAGARWLQLTCTGVSMLPGDMATLTIHTADGKSAVYTIRGTEDMSGNLTSVIDLTAPDGLAVPGTFWGDGIGLVTPQPMFHATSAFPPYTRATADGVSNEANSRVSSIVLTVPGASETFTIASAQFLYTTGIDSWVDQFDDGGRINTESQSDPSVLMSATPPFIGSLVILQDGKRSLVYPYYGKISGGVGLTWYDPFVPLMLADLIYDLSVSNSNIAAAYSIVGSTSATINDIPVGMIRSADDVPYGATDYIPWTDDSGTSKTFNLLCELNAFTVPIFSCQYDMTMRWIHGGGVEGIAYSYVTGQAVVSNSFKITHALASGATSHSNAPPTGDVVVPTDAGGFWRSIFYDQELPTIKGLAFPRVPGIIHGHLGTVPQFPQRLDPWGNTYGYIKEITYNHFASVLSPIIPPRVANLARRDGTYHRALNLTDDTYYLPAGIGLQSCDTGAPLIILFGIPTDSWRDAENVVVIDGDPGDSNPCMALDHRGRLHCVFDRQTTLESDMHRMAVPFECHSDDDGGRFDILFPTMRMWSAPVPMDVPNGQYPIIKSGLDGSLYRVAYVDDGTMSGTGTLWGQYQAPGDIDPSTPFQLMQEDGATPIPVQIGAFDMAHLAETAARWILTVLGVTTGIPDTQPSEWVSSDDGGGTFTKLTT